LTNFQDKDLTQLKLFDNKVRGDWNDARDRMIVLSKGTEEYKKGQKKVTQTENEVDVVGYLISIYEFAAKINGDPNGRSGPLENWKSEAQEDWKEINMCWAAMRSTWQNKLDRFYTDLIRVTKLELGPDDRYTLGGSTTGLDT
jgi:hypothetical protein